MSGTLSDNSPDLQLVKRIADVEEAVESLRANQVQKITYGDITIDGTGPQGVISIGNGLTLTVDAAGNGIIKIGNITISGKGVGKISIGNLSINGDGSIIVNDGTNDRVLIGMQVGGF
jgi:hypothetical protein